MHCYVIMLCVNCCRVCSMADLRQRFEPPNESNRWDCPLFKVHMGRSQLPAPPSPPLSAHLSCTTAGCSGANSGAMNPSPRPGLAKSSFKRAAPPPSRPPVPVPEEEEASCPPAPAPGPAPATIPMAASSSSCSSVSFSGTTAAARDVDADPSFQSPEAVVLSICDHFFSGDRAAPAPAPANASTAAVQKGDAALLYELDRTSMRVLQVRHPFP